MASQSDYSDEEDEKHQEEDVEEEPPGGAPFVPASLRSLRPVMSQVEETLEEVRGTVSRMHAIHSFYVLFNLRYIVHIRCTFRVFFGIGYSLCTLFHSITHALHS